MQDGIISFENEPFAPAGRAQYFFEYRGLHIRFRIHEAAVEQQHHFPVVRVTLSYIAEMRFHHRLKCCDAMLEIERRHRRIARIEAALHEQGGSFRHDTGCTAAFREPLREHRERRRLAGARTPREHDRYGPWHSMGSLMSLTQIWATGERLGSQLELQWYLSSGTVHRHERNNHITGQYEISGRARHPCRRHCPRFPEDPGKRQDAPPVF